MNPNLTSTKFATGLAPAINPRIRRIRTFSRILKVMLLAYLVVLPLSLIAIGAAVAGLGLTFHNWNSGFATLPMEAKVLFALSNGIYWLIGVTFYRLLNLYEAGVFFSPANVRLFRKLGYLAFTKGLLGVVTPMALIGKLAFPSLIFGVFGSP
jgi:hypothetical protein